jgi:hypothetical protein
VKAIIGGGGLATVLLTPYCGSVKIPAVKGHNVDRYHQKLTSI